MRLIKGIIKGVVVARLLRFVTSRLGGSSGSGRR